jgi:chemotaxis signal transduction protein
MRLCALPLERVAETMRPLPLDTLPQMPPPLLGMAVIRANAVPVLDLGLLLGAPMQAPPARFVSLKLDGGRSVAVAVTEVVGVYRLDAAAMAQVPPLLRDAADGIVCALSLLDAELLLVLQASRLVPEAVWAAVDSKTVAA